MASPGRSQTMNPTPNATASVPAIAQPSPPASYCPATNTISVDLSAMQELGEVASERNKVLVQGDNTALSVLASRYALAVQHEKGETLDTANAALRTACLTGVSQAAMASPIELPSGGNLTLTAGDLDEAVAGLLTNGLAASNGQGGGLPVTGLPVITVAVIGAALVLTGIMVYRFTRRRRPADL